MSTRIKLLVILCLAIAGTVLWYTPAARDLAMPAIAFVQENILYVLAATITLIAALTFLFVRSTSVSRNRKRELDEYMRVVQQTASIAPQTFKRVLIDDAPETDLASLNRDTNIPQKTPQRGAATDRKTKKRQAAQSELAAISEDLYFQPVTDVSEGQIIGYEIYRQAKQKSRQNPIFVQHTPIASKADQAEFEYSTLEKTTSATQHEMWADIVQTNQISFFVQIGDALLDDKSLWRRAASMLRKQIQSNPSIALVVRSACFANAPQKVINERLLKLKRLHNSGVPLVLRGFKHDHMLVTEDQLSSFYLSSCCKDELLSCYAGEAAEDINAAYKQIAKLSLDTSVRGIVSETDVVDSMAAGAKFMSGDYLAPPRKLKADASVGPAVHENTN